MRISPAALCLLLVLALAALWPAAAALAQTPPQPASQTVGPYRVTVAQEVNSLSLGRVSVAAEVVNAATNEAVPGLREVKIITTHPASGATGFALALNQPLDPAVYRAELTLDRAGEWRLQLEIAGALGHAVADIPPVTIPVAQNYAAGSWVFIGATLIILGGAGYVIWTIRREQRRRAVPPQRRPADA